MRIGIDAREICGHPTGVGRYLSGLLAEWAADPGPARHDFVLYAPAQVALTLDARRFASRLVAGDGGSRWEQVQLPAAAARDHLDVFFAPAYTSPLFWRVPTVLAVHDVSFAAHPEWFTMREGIRRRSLVRRAAAVARAVVTISQFSRRELVERMGVADDRIRVIPPGITAPPGAPAASEPKVLYVGSIFNRRHLPDLVRAFGILARARQDVTLDIVGDNRSYPHQDLHAVIRAEGLEGRAQWRRWVEDDELRRLYAASRAFAFLSSYEGLGLTPLEALAAGVPPVLLDTPIARESCGDAARYVPTVEHRSLARALEALLFDESARRDVLDQAPAVLARYDWPRAARDTLAVLEGAA